MSVSDMPEFSRPAGFVLLAGVFLLSAWGCGRGAKEQPASSQGPAAAAVEPGTQGRVPAPDTRPVIVALGDSLTAGLGVDPTNSYPARLQARLDAAGYRYRVVNAGVSGDTSAQGLNRLDPVVALKPRIVIVALGANDGLRGIPVEVTRRNLDEILRTLQRDGVTVLLAGLEIPPNYGSEYTAAFRNMYSQLAREHRAAFLPFLLEGVGGHPDLNQEDGIHPTAEGYAVVADNLWKVLQPMLDRSS